MTYVATMAAGDKNIVLPNGVRYQGSAVVTLSDRWYGKLSPNAQANLMTHPAPGGTVSHQVTLAAGKNNVVLPNGLRYQAGQTAILSDEEYSLISVAARGVLFSADTTTLT